MTRHSAILVLVLLSCLQPSLARRGSCSAPAIQNGAARLRRRGQKITYKCYRGHSRVGPSQANCVRGSWRPAEVPICVSTGCEPLSRPDNAQQENLQSWLGFPVEAGSVVRFSCHEGHVMEGEDTVWCDGILWNSSVPLCSLPISPARPSCNFDDVDVDPWCGWSQR